MKIALFAVALLLVGCVSSAPTAQGKGGARNREQSGDEVQQLDQLRQNPSSHGVSVVKTQESHITSVNGKTEGSGSKQETVKDLGSDKTVASVKHLVKVNQEASEDKPHMLSQTQLDIPSLGIHRTKVDDSDAFQQRDIDNEKKSYPWAGQLDDKLEPFQDYLPAGWRVRYTPGDLAEYILRTGDEEGVALAIEELLSQGVLSREEAIAYLHEVKQNMADMRNYLENEQNYEAYRRLHGLKEGISMKRKSEAQYQPHQRQNMLDTKERFPTKPQAPHQKAQSKSSAPAPTTKTPAKSSSSTKTAVISPTAPPKKHRRPTILEGGEQLNDLQMHESQDQLFQPDVDISAILEELKSANSLYEEYTLEEIIYWLAKDMLAQSFAKGDQSGEEALARFASFVENEVAQNKISTEVQKKVLDIMLAALVDILREFPNNQYGPSNQLMDTMPRRMPGAPHLKSSRGSLLEAKRNADSKKESTSSGQASSSAPEQRKPSAGKNQKS